MLKEIQNIVSDFKSLIENKTIKIISHYDTDGITSAAIFAKALQRADKKFSIRIIRQLEHKIIDQLRTEQNNSKDILVFLDLGSSSIDDLKNIPTDIFVLDHHEIRHNQEKSNVRVINPHLFNEDINAAAVTYLFARELDSRNKDLASLAVLGMVGDMMGQTISKMSNSILKDAEDIIIKKGPLIFSATRPLNKSLEFSSDIFIPGVTGSSAGVLNFLREVGIKPEKGRYPTLLDLREEEMSKLITSILLKRIYGNRNENDSVIGAIYLIKFFNRLEDARELSTLINACSRLGHSDIALSFCLGNAKSRTKAEEIYNLYKRELIDALNWISKAEKIEGEGYVIINAQNNIKDSLIGTSISVLASSFLHKPGTVLIGTAYQEENIKVSARISGRVNSINLNELLNYVIAYVGGSGGGHVQAAGCLIPKEKEDIFIETLKRVLEEQCVKIKI